MDGPAAPVAARLAAPPYSSDVVVDRAARARALSTDPVALGISGALYIGFAAAAIFAVIGFAVSSAISAAERKTEFAVLRSVGLSRGQLSGALAIEGGLTACLALAVGTALGVLLAWFVLPYVSLSGEGGRPFPDVIVHFPWRTAASSKGALLARSRLVVALEIRILAPRPPGAGPARGRGPMSRARAPCSRLSSSPPGGSDRDPPLTAAVFGVVLVTSFVFAAAPRAFESNADEGLRFAVQMASPFERNVEITRAGRIEPVGPGSRSTP